MRPHRTFLFLALVAAILAGSVPAEATLRATVDRQEVLPGETITLTLRQDDPNSAAAPDLSVLEEYFQILDIRQSRQVKIINGDRTESTDWLVVLLPNNASVTTIPSIRAGAETTAPIRVSMVVPEKGTRADRPEVFVEAEVEGTEGFVGAEVLYTVRVYDKGKMQSGTLRPPEIPGAQIESSGDSKTREVILDGERYSLYEQQFRITPEKSGSLNIAPAILEARMRREPSADRRRQRSFFGDFFDRAGQAGPITRIASNPLALEIRARPGATEGWFLPAKVVQLDEVWSAASGDLRVGEALTRTVSLRVLGAASEQLPVFVIPGPIGARQYAEGTREGTRPSPEGTVSVREESVSIIPTAAGSLEFPAVEVKWFDVEAQEPRIARIAATSFDILPALGTPSEPPPPAEVRIPSSSTADVRPTRPTALGLSGRTVALVLAALLALSVVLTLAVLRFHRRANTRTETPRALAKRVLAAARKPDAQEARQAVIQWAETVLPGPFTHSLVDIGERLGDAPLAAELQRLNQCLFSPDPKPWSGKTLAAAFRPVARRKNVPIHGTNTTPLPSLYPST